jgi:hypothetical protein
MAIDTSAINAAIQAATDANADVITQTAPENAVKDNMKKVSN